MDTKVAVLVRLVFTLLCCTSGTSLACTNNTSVGVAHQLEVSLSSPVSICIQLNNSEELEPIRVSVTSENATSRHPVLVTVRQPMGINSWTLPYVESGFAFSSVERTLCPLLNNDNSGSAILYIDLSTTQTTPLSVALSTALITPFKLQMNTPVSLEASPSGPSYLLYEYEDPPTDQHVRINVLSTDNSSDICAIASIQTSFCPMVELLDNPNHRGTFQTMRSVASITAQENETDSGPHFGFFYVVLSVLPTDGVNGSCVSTAQGIGDELILLRSAINNFNPTPYSGLDRTKIVNITVELVNPNLPAAIAVPTVMYLLFVIIALVWIGVTTFRRTQHKKIYDISGSNSNGQPSGDIDLQEQHSGNGNAVKEGTATASNGASQNGHSTASENGHSTASENGHSTAQEMTQPGTFKINIAMSELGEIDDSPARQKVYYHYFWYLLVVIVFYSIPAYQLVTTYQKLLLTSGNEDICYYNTRCATPWLSVSAINNIFSNIGYIILGFLYIVVTYLRRRRYRRLEKHNAASDNEKQGIPETFGIYYAIGLVMIAQAFMSGAYHLCPSTTNYQLDVTFLYVMISLAMFKVLTNRAPDLAPALHRQALYLMTLILAVILGGIWFEYLAFKVVFIIAYLVLVVYFSFEMYYRFKFGLKLDSTKELYKLHTQGKFWRIQHPCKFFTLLISLVVNAVIAGGIFLADESNIDFARYFLLIILVNFMIYLLYYLFAKAIKREYFTPRVFKPVLYSILAILMWIVAIYFFTRNVTDTSVSPALSRDNNQECVLFGFYDTHDLWHFISAFALYFSFILLLTLDEGLEIVPRNKIMTL